MTDLATPNAVLVPETTDADAPMVGVKFDDLTPDDKEFVTAGLAQIVVEETPNLDVLLQQNVAEAVAAVVLKHSSKALQGPAEEYIAKLQTQKTFTKLVNAIERFEKEVESGNFSTKADVAKAVSKEALGGAVREFLLSASFEEAEAEQLALGMGDAIRLAMEEQIKDVSEAAILAAQEEMASKQATTPWGQVGKDAKALMGRAPFDPFRTTIEAAASIVAYNFVASRIGWLPNSRIVVVTVGAGAAAVAEGLTLLFRRRGRKGDPSPE